MGAEQDQQLIEKALHEKRDRIAWAPLHRQYIPVALVLCVGVALSVALFFLVREWERQQSLYLFEHDVREISSRLERSLSADLEVLGSIRGLYTASDNVDRQVFRAFVAGALSRHPDIQALEWIPYVPYSQREKYEEAARKDGYPNFQFAERDNEGRPVAAGRRAEYFPVYYVEPLAGNEVALGFDLGSNPARLEALERARDTGAFAATARITLVQETGKQFGLLVFLPVYQPGALQSTVEERRASLKGFALAVFRIGDLVEGSLGNMDASSYSIHLNDEGAPPERKLLYESERHTNGQTLDEAIRAGLYEVVPLEVGGRRWSLLVHSTSGHATMISLAPGALVAGLLLTILLAAYLQMALDRAGELSRINSRLEKEVSERKMAEEALGRSLEEKAHSQQLLLALSQAAQAVQRAVTPEEVFKIVLDEVARFNFRAAILTLTEDRKHLAISHMTFQSILVQAAEKLTGLTVHDFRLALVPGSFYYRIVFEGETIFIESFSEAIAEALPAPVRTIADRIAALLGITRGIGAALMVDGKTFGMLTVSGTGLTAEDVPAVSTFGNQIAIAIEKARLLQKTRELAITDGLTGLYNHRHLHEALSKEAKRARRYKRTVSMVMLDVDHFKLINDSYGHQVGDMVLKSLATVLRNAVREMDHVARYGGEEFAIILPETPAKEAAATAERIRQAIENHEFKVDHKRIRLTASAGVASSSFNRDESTDELVRRADNALYEAKRKGRNQVQVATLSSLGQGSLS